MRYFLGLKVLIVGLLICGLTGAAVAGPFDDLLRHIPDDANVLLAIDGKPIRGSEFYKTSVSQEGKGNTRSMIFPVPQVERAMIGAQFRNIETALLSWQMSVLETHTRSSLQDIAQFQGGKIETLGKTELVRLPDDSYLFSPTRNVFNVLTPADRQLASRAVKWTATQRTPELPDFLQESFAHFKTGGYPLLLALDLENVADPERVRQRLANFGAEIAKRNQKDQLTNLLAGIRGIRLEMRFGKTAKGTITVEFGQDAGALATIAKPLFLELLDQHGARIYELTDWTVEMKGKSVLFTGELSLPSLRQILSLLDASPPSVHDTADEPEKPASDDKSAAATASLRHYRTVQSLLDELRDPKNRKDFTQAESGLWYEKYARRIDQLPVLNVDPDLLEYSAEVAARLRMQSAKFRSVGIKAGVENRNANTNYWYYGNAYYYQRTESNYASVKRVEASAAAGENVDQMNAIAEATAKIRREMTQRYNVEF